MWATDIHAQNKLHQGHVKSMPPPHRTFASAEHMPCHSFEKYKDCFDYNSTEGRESQIWPGAQRTAMDCSVYCTNLEQDPCLFCLNES